MATILVVDDEPDLRTLITFRLERDGHITMMAANGEAALLTAQNWRPDLILLDVMMPIMDGFETLERLKAGEETRDIPVIMLTAKSDYPSVLRGWNMDVENYLTKPFDIDELAQVVREVLTYRRHAAAAGAAVPATA